jgi:hypothetical protein
MAVHPGVAHPAMSDRIIVAWVTSALLCLATFPVRAGMPPGQTPDASSFVRLFATMCLRTERTPQALMALAQTMAAETDPPFHTTIGDTIGVSHSFDANGLHLMVSWDDSAVWHSRILGCLVEGPSLSLSETLPLLSALPELGRPNANQSPSIIALDAQWRVKTRRETVWVGLAVNSFAHSAFIALHAHQHLP